MRRRVPGAAALLLTCLGIWLIFGGVWIHAKAALAQHLIGRAWQEARAGSAPTRPWPWADMAPLAVLEVPDRGIRQIVLSGASGRTLAFGPAHLDGTAAPGSDGVVVLSGHRDTHFAFLRDVAPGDRIVLEDRRGGRRRFRIDTIEIADSRRAKLRLESAAPVLVLVTCYPFDAIDPGGPLRYVVTAVAEPRA